MDTAEFAEALKNAIDGEEEDEIYAPIEDTEFLRGEIFLYFTEIDSISRPDIV